MLVLLQLSNQVIQLATLFALICGLGLLAWIAGFIYARERRAATGWQATTNQLPATRPLVPSKRFIPSKEPAFARTDNFKKKRPRARLAWPNLQLLRPKLPKVPTYFGVAILMTGVGFGSIKFYPQLTDWSKNQTRIAAASQLTTTAPTPLALPTADVLGPSFLPTTSTVEVLPATSMPTPSSDPTPVPANTYRHPAGNIQLTYPLDWEAKSQPTQSADQTQSRVVFVPRKTSASAPDGETSGIQVTLLAEPTATIPSPNAWLAAHYTGPFFPPTLTSDPVTVQTLTDHPPKSFEFVTTDTLEHHTITFYQIEVGGSPALYTFDMARPVSTPPNQAELIQARALVDSVHL